MEACGPPNSKWLSIPAHTKSVNALELFRDVVFTGSGDNNIGCWDIQNGKLKRTYVGHDGFVSSLAFVGGKLFSAGYDRAVGIWDVEAGKLIRSAKIHAGPVTHVRSSHNENLLLSGAWDKVVRLWDLRNNARQNLGFADVERTHSDAVLSISIRDHEMYCGLYNRTIELSDLRKAGVLAVFKGHAEYVTSVALHRDMLYSGGHDGRVYQTPLTSSYGGDVDLTDVGTVCVDTADSIFAVQLTESPHGPVVLSGHMGYLLATPVSKSASCQAEQVRYPAHSGQQIFSLCVRGPTTALTGGNDGMVIGWGIKPPPWAPPAAAQPASPPPAPDAADVAEETSEANDARRRAAEKLHDFVAQALLARLSVQTAAAEALAVESAHPPPSPPRTPSPPPQPLVEEDESKAQVVEESKTAVVEEKQTSKPVAPAAPQRSASVREPSKRVGGGFVRQGSTTSVTSPGSSPAARRKAPAATASKSTTPSASSTGGGGGGAKAPSAAAKVAPGARGVKLSQKVTATPTPGASGKKSTKP